MDKTPHLTVQSATPPRTDASHLNAFYCCSDVYAPIAGVSITSLFMSNQDLDTITVYILSDNISDKNLERFQTLAKQYKREIIIIDAQKLISLVQQYNLKAFKNSFVVYGRVFCVDLTGLTDDRIITIDSDTIIQGSLKPLLGWDLQDNCMAMTYEPFAAYDGKYYSDKPISFNAGIIVYDVKKWREEGWSQIIREHLSKQDTIYVRCDQDIINFICGGHIATLPMEYNFLTPNRVFPYDDYYHKNLPYFYTEEQMRYAREHQVVAHLFQFLGGRPWTLNSAHPDTELFDRYLQKSLWKDYEKKPAPMSMIERLEKTLYRVLPRRLFFVLFNAAQKLVSYNSLRQHMNPNVTSISKVWAS